MNVKYDLINQDAERNNTNRKESLKIFIECARRSPHVIYKKTFSIIKEKQCSVYCMQTIGINRCYA